MTTVLSDTSYLVPPLMTGAVTLALLTMALLWSRRDFTTGLFSAFLFSMVLWNFSIFGMRSSPDIDHALLWQKAGNVPTIAAFVFYYHFTLILTNTRGQRYILRASYLFLIVLAALAPTDLLIKGIRVEDYGYAPIVAPASYLWFAIGPLLTFGGVRNLLKYYRVSTSNEERSRLTYLAIAAVFPFIGIVLDGFTNLPPVSIWSNLVFSILCTIAILKYHLLDIRVIMRRSLVYLLVSTVVAIPYAGVLLLVNQILKTSVEPWWIHAIIIVLLAIALRPLYGWGQNVVNRLFYRDRYDCIRALERFSHEFRSIANPEDLGSTLVKLVSGALSTSSASLLLPSKGENGFVVASSVGLDNCPSGTVVRGESLLVKWLKLKGRILSSVELDIIPELQSLTCRERQNLAKLQAELYVPIKYRDDELSGVLILGQKRDKQLYSDEDIQLLSTLASQVAINLENVRLYTDTIRTRKNLEMWLNGMSDCVMIVNSDCTVEFMNKAAIENFGVRVGGVCWNVLEQDATCPDCPITLYLHDNRRTHHYVSSIGGREYHVAVAPLLNPDGSTSLIEVLRDVTEQEEAAEREKQLQQELNLSSRLASIGKLAAGVAHEINNPLTGILGFSERLLRRSTSEEISEDLEVIHSEAQRAAVIVKNLLTFARRREQEKRYSDINDIVQRTLELRAYELKTSNIEIVTDLSAVLPGTMADFQQIQEVLLNIILNAEQAMTQANHGGKLSIKTEETKSYIRISITDDGPGIKPEHLDKLFDPFFTLREGEGGTGLGLSICHGIVADHGGRIYAKSKPGKGATFFVELPAATGKIDEGKVQQKEPFERSK